QTASKASLGEPSVFGFMGVVPGLKIRPLVERVARAIGRLGYSVTVAGSEAQHAPTEWFSNVEHVHDFVLYAAEADEASWKLLVGRQVDRLFRVARGARPPPLNLDLIAGTPLAAQQLVDLILVQKADCPKPQGSEVWMAA